MNCVLVTVIVVFVVYAAVDVVVGVVAPLAHSLVDWYFGFVAGLSLAYFMALSSTCHSTNVLKNLWLDFMWTLG